MRRRLALASACILCVVTCALGALIALGSARPSWYVNGGHALGVTGSCAEIAWSNGVLTRQRVSWRINSAQGSASILVAPRSAWRPSSSSAAIGAGPGAGSGALFTLTVWYIPLWPPFCVFAAGTGAVLVLVLRGRAPAAGHCRCGYNLAGLTSRRCPECGGRVAVSLVRPRRFPVLARAVLGGGGRRHGARPSAG